MSERAVVGVRGGGGVFGVSCGNLFGVSAQRHSYFMYL